MVRKNILRYASASANLYNFLGDTNFEHHMDVYKSVVDNALKAHEDIKNFAVEHARVVDPANVLEQLPERPVLFVTFHTGSYNNLVCLLLKRGHQVHVLSDTDSVANNDYNQVSELYSNRYKNGCSMEMVNVEEQGAIFSIIKQMKQGIVTLAYLDGNKGVGGQTKHNENMVDISFLNGRVKVRKGLAFISYLLKIPVVVVLNYTVDGIDYIRFHEPIQPVEKDREQYCLQTIQSIFDIFQQHVRQYYDQWSNWLYVHLWTDLDYFRQKLTSHASPTTASAQGGLRFNEHRFCPLRLDGKLYLFDRILYRAIPVDESYKDIFSYKTSTVEKTNCIEKLTAETPDKTRELIEKHVLIEV
ncbi:lysophospholipid acyltransferase family protein [Ohtaekwangia koreensis]|uniref:Lauroyl/myristoyl acyltransferase n=1 Tax=Ohtaekwangia koreensis TaxID=688867 RepID=A0A1T5M5L6_9BACT|nr:hypothetical protein [Ohtaekwangia koreensis]SKC83334.1 hypothetical protein SAMN05660236_4425 [Ohtaekwangia koreensis]